LDFFQTWIDLYLGTRAAAEQPATNAHHALGTPLCFTNGTKHGGKRHKVFTWWGRELDAVPDGDDTPLSMLLPRLSGSTPEKRMLKRTETPLTLARSHTAAWNVDVWNVSEAGRPANVPHSGHEPAMKLLMHRYYLFAAGFAPHISAHEVMNETLSSCPSRTMVTTS